MASGVAKLPYDPQLVLQRPSTTEQASLLAALDALTVYATVSKALDEKKSITALSSVPSCEQSQASAGNQVFAAHCVTCCALPSTFRRSCALLKSLRAA